MPLSALPLPPIDLPPAFRWSLMNACHQAHRPELADLVASARLRGDGHQLWLEPAAGFSDLDPAWLEGCLLAAAAPAGLSVEAVHVCSTGRGREVA